MHPAVFRLLRLFTKVIFSILFEHSLKPPLLFLLPYSPYMSEYFSFR